MACKNCGSVWTTKNGNDCKTCPYCCKLQRNNARKDGRWIEPTQQKTCEECGAVFTAVGLHNIAIQVLCKSQGCKASRRKRQRKASFMRITEGVCTLPRRQKQKRHCQRLGCGKELTCRDQKHYCGKPCYFAAIREGKQQFKGRVRDEWAALVDWAYGWDADRRSCERAIRTHRPCICCGKANADSGHSFCSRECLVKWRGTRTCKKCGDVFADASWCATTCRECRKLTQKECRRKSGRSHFRSRARKYGVPYESFSRGSIYSRDKWTCQLCGRKCLLRWTLNKKTKIPHPRSPTIDHIVPLSRGGPHSRDNVQLSCFECNCKKSDARRGQLRLAGCS